MSSISLTDAQLGQLAATLSVIASGEAPPSRLLSDTSPALAVHCTTAQHQTPVPLQVQTFIRPPHQPVPTNLNSPDATSSSSSKQRTTRSITFANGTWLEFHADDVRPPPAISFADNLRLLNEMWDDTPEHWGGHSVLNIKGVPIPIVYWKEVYARSKSGGWKPNQWKQVKGCWFEWKVLSI